MESDFSKYLRLAQIAGQNPSLVGTRIGYSLQRSGADVLAKAGYYKYDHHIIFLAGMAMSGSTWMKNLLARIPGYYTRETPMPKDVQYNQDICDSAFSHTPGYGYTLFKTHLNPTRSNLDCIDRHGVTKILITYRDLRDIVVSRYHRLVGSPKAKDAPDYIDYCAMSKEKALDHSLEMVATYYVDWIRGWLDIAAKDPERYLFVRFEDLRVDTVGTYKKVLSFYGISLPDELVAKNVEAARGKGGLRKNRKVGQILPFAFSSNFRAGTSGHWRQELSADQITHCKELLGPILIELGYEKDLNWSDI